MSLSENRQFMTKTGIHWFGFLTKRFPVFFDNAGLNLLRKLMANEDSISTPSDTLLTTHGVESSDTSNLPVFSIRLNLKLSAETVLSDDQLPDGKAVECNPAFQPLTEESSLTQEQVYFHAVEGGKIASYAPRHNTIDLNQLLSGKHTVPAGLQRLATLLCTRKQAADEDLIDQVLFRLNHDASDSHCDCESSDGQAYAINLLDPAHQRLLIVNYEGQQYELYPSS